MTKKGHLLIVDDNPENIKVLGTLLSKEGYELSVSQSGHSALEQVDDIEPDLILLDVLMPELDGFETCKRLKKKENLDLVPIVFLTAKSEVEDLVYGFELGAADYITKPFNKKELLVRVKNHLELKHARDRLAQANQEQKELIQILCHDLANPMNHIISVLDAIQHYGDFENYQGLLKESAENGLNIIELVKGMRSLEDREITTGEVNLNSAIESSTNMLSPKFKDKNIAVSVRISGEFIVQAEMVSLINSVLNNVLTNSIKFSYPGSEIVLSVEKDQENTHVKIKDSGIGIPKKILDHIFDFEKSTSRRGTLGEKGNGFGLPLVKKFMDAYGGSIKVISKLESKSDSTEQGTEVELIFQNA